MSSFMPWPRRPIIWKCPQCGKETVTVSGPPPWIMTGLPFFGSRAKIPICPKCRIKMKRQNSFTI